MGDLLNHIKKTTDYHQAKLSHFRWYSCRETMSLIITELSMAI